MSQGQHNGTSQQELDDNELSRFLKNFNPLQQNQLQLKNDDEYYVITNKQPMITFPHKKHESKKILLNLNQRKLSE